MFMFLSGKSSVSVVLLSVVLLGLQGCGGTTPSRSEDIAQNSSSSSPASRMPPGQTDYSQILNQMGLGKLFTFQEPHTTIRNGKITEINVTLSSKGIDNDTNTICSVTGTSAKDSLAALGNKIADALSQKAGVTPNRVKTIVREGKCKVNIQDGKVYRDDDRDTELEFSTSETPRLKEFNEMIKELADKYKIPRITALTEEIFKTYCSNTLQQGLSSLGLEYDVNCNNIQFPNKDRNYYVIKDVKTVGLFTDGYREQFDIKMTDTTQRFDEKGSIKIGILNATYSSGAIGGYYLNEISKLKDGGKKILDAESYFITWYEKQVKVK